MIPCSYLYANSRRPELECRVTNEAPAECCARCQGWEWCPQGSLQKEHGVLGHGCTWAVFQEQIPDGASRVGVHPRGGLVQDNHLSLSHKGNGDGQLPLHATWKAQGARGEWEEVSQGLGGQRRESWGWQQNRAVPGDWEQLYCLLRCRSSVQSPGGHQVLLIAG